MVSGNDCTQKATLQTTESVFELISTVVDEWCNGLQWPISKLFIWYDSFEILWDPATILKQQMSASLFLSMPRQNSPDAMQTVIISLSTPY